MAFGCTITVTAGKIPSSQSNFVWLAVASNFPLAAKNGGASSILNGGGNLRCYTDDTKTTQLPIEVVSFVTGGTPDIQVWGLSPALNVASTVYIEADSVATTQPALGAAFGRNAVWVDFEYSFHFGGATLLIDSAGKYSLTELGVVSQTAGIAGQAADNSLSTDNSLSVTGYAGPSGSLARTHTGWIKTSSTSIVGVVSYGTSASGKKYVSRTDGGKLRVEVQGSFATSANTVSNGVFHRFSLKNDGTTTFPACLSVNIDGGDESLTVGGNISLNTESLDNVVFANGGPGTSYANDVYDEYSLRLFRVSDDMDLSEYNNQNDPSTFWSTSSWVDNGGGGVTVTGTTPSFNYSSIAASIDLTGSIDVTGQTANYTYSAVNGNIDLTGDISVTGATASYNYQSINGVVDLTGEITVLGSTPSQSYSSVSGIIELGAVISVVGLTPNYNYQGIAGEVSLNGEILVSGETPSYSYSAIKGFVTTGEAQVIGTVTSSFASDVYSSGFKPSTITVNFKS